MVNILILFFPALCPGSPLPSSLWVGIEWGSHPQHPEYISHVVCVIFHLRLSVFKNEIMLFVRDSCFFPATVMFGGVQHRTV